jgi:hypothetical protein
MYIKISGFKLPYMQQWLYTINDLDSELRVDRFTSSEKLSLEQLVDTERTYAQSLAGFDNYKQYLQWKSTAHTDFVNYIDRQVDRKPRAVVDSG